MAVKFDRIPKETLVERICNEVEDINEINMAKQAQREVLLAVIEKRPKLITKIRHENEEAFLTYIIKERPEYFVYLKREQYNDKLAQMYLLYRIDSNKAKKNDRKDGLVVQKSLDDRILFLYTYLTPEGDELNYVDNELNIPLSLKSSFKLTLKLEDAICLINKLDLNVAQLGENKILTTILDLVSNRYVKFLTNYIKDNNLGYYSLMTSLGDIERGFVQEISRTFNEYGLSVSSFIIQRLAIPADIKNKIEDLAFTIRQRKINVEADAEIEKISLANYESKLAVQQRYPEAVHSLTEYEKDLALQRYLVKVGKKEEEEINRSIQINKTVEKADTSIAVKEDVAPEKTDNKFSLIYYIALAVALLVSFIVMRLKEYGTGMIILGISVIVFGVLGSLNRDKLLPKKSKEGAKGLWKIFKKD